MSRELTEKKRRNIRGDKVAYEPETIQEPYQDTRTPYTGNTQADFIEVEGKKIVSTHYLLNAYIANLKKGIHKKVESKAESDRFWLDLYKGKTGRELLEPEMSLDQYKNYIKWCMPPIANNYYYTFTSHGIKTYEPVEFKVTKVNKTYGFTRQDTGECCNFTIVKNGNGGFTYKLQELDDFNLPEWVGGW